MSIITQAERELAGWPANEREAMLDIMRKFFDTWDSGGAVSHAAPVLQRLIAGKPLGPLTGEDDEWIEVGPSVFQNARCSTVFKQERGGKMESYDIDVYGRPTITFPYWPERADVRSPVIEI